MHDVSNKKTWQLTPENLAHIAWMARTQARISMLDVCGGEWAGLISIIIRESGSEDEQFIQCGSMPCRVQVPGELARVYINTPDRSAIAAPFLLPLRKEIEPFIIGVGNVRTEDTPEGIVVIRNNDG
jgi:hypothetical protein